MCCVFNEMLTQGSVISFAAIDLYLQYINTEASG
jgi:hypothetical protein